MSASILFRRDRRNSVVSQLKPRAPAEPAGALGGTPSATRLTVPSSPERLHCQTGRGDGYRTRVKLMVKVFDFVQFGGRVGPYQLRNRTVVHQPGIGLGGTVGRGLEVPPGGSGQSAGTVAEADLPRVPVSPAPSFSARWVLRRGSVNVHHLWPSKGGQSPRPSAELWQPQGPKNSHSGHMICTIRRPLG